MQSNGSVSRENRVGKVGVRASRRVCKSTKEREEPKGRKRQESDSRRVGKRGAVMPCFLGLLGHYDVRMEPGLDARASTHLGPGPRVDGSGSKGLRGCIE